MGFSGDRMNVRKESGKEYSEFMRLWAERYERLMPKPTVLEVFCGVFFSWLVILFFVVCAVIGFLVLFRVLIEIMMAK